MSKPDGPEIQFLRAGLRDEIDVATSTVARVEDNGGGAATAIRELLSEGEPYIGAGSDDARGPDGDDADSVTIARRGVEGSGQRIPRYDVVQRLFGSRPQTT